MQRACCAATQLCTLAAIGKAGLMITAPTPEAEQDVASRGAVCGRHWLQRPWLHRHCYSIPTIFVEMLKCTDTFLLLASWCLSNDKVDTALGSALCFRRHFALLMVKRVVSPGGPRAMLPGPHPQLTMEAIALTTEVPPWCAGMESVPSKFCSCWPPMAAS